MHVTPLFQEPLACLARYVETYWSAKNLAYPKVSFGSFIVYFSFSLEQVANFTLRVAVLAEAHLFLKVLLRSKSSPRLILVRQSPDPSYRMWPPSPVLMCLSSITIANGPSNYSVWRGLPIGGVAVAVAVSQSLQPNTIDRSHTARVKYSPWASFWSLHLCFSNNSRG